MLDGRASSTRKPQTGHPGRHPKASADRARKHALPSSTETTAHGRVTPDSPLDDPAVSVLAIRGQIKLADETYRRVRAACCYAAAGIDLDEHAARITIAVHRARVRARVNYDGPGACAERAPSAGATGGQ